MGIRETQIQGLPSEAEKFLDENAKKSELKICSECKHQTGGERILTKCGTYIGMFEEEYDLSRYELKDGGYADEYEQCSPWSSGPVIFLGLKVVVKEEVGEREYKIEWSEQEIEERL